MIFRSVIPIGTSTRPVFFTLPTSENIFVPLLLSVPIDVRNSAPLLMIKGMLAQVSTLLMLVGLSHSPLTAGYGGLALGSPGLPSSDRRSAVSSPHTNAPAPRCTL